MENNTKCGGCRKNCTEPVKGCGKCCRGSCTGVEISLTDSEIEFMTLLSQIPFLPLARIIIKCSDRDDREIAPVYISCENETSESVLKAGQVLLSLRNRGLITLDYDKPLVNGDYSIYKNPVLLKKICETAAADSSSFIPEIEFGSIALTSLGIDVLDSLDIQ